MKTCRFFAVLAFAFVMLTICSFAQTGSGARFGTRDPRTCASRNANSPSADQLKQYFICEMEHVTKSSSFGDSISLVSAVNLQFSKSRPFNASTDGWPSIDVGQPLYDVRGSYTWWTCFLPGDPKIATFPHVGKNCFKSVGESTKGMCFRDTFGDWHCKVCCTPTTTKYEPPPGPADSFLFILPGFQPKKMDDLFLGMGIEVPARGEIAEGQSQLS